MVLGFKDSDLFQEDAAAGPRLLPPLLPHPPLTHSPVPPLSPLWSVTLQVKWIFTQQHV